MREKTPVYHNPGSETQPPVWVLTRHADICAVSGDGENFSSMQGAIVAPDAFFKLDPKIQEDLSRFMITMDNPEHNRYRRLVMPAVAPAAIARLEARISASVEALIEGLKGRNEVDFVTEVGAVVPIKTVCAIMGVPEEDEHLVFDFTNAVFGFGDPELSPSLETANKNFLAVLDYGWDLARKRRENPCDDVMSIIAHATIDGEPLSRVDQTSFFTNMIAAGNETTRSSLSGAIWLLAKHPDQRRLLIDDPGMIESALDELLRRHTPGIHMARTAKCDVEVGGALIKKGERVAMLYGAGNHDPSVFPDPYRLDLRRNNAREHLAFGTGIHHCLGWRLARLQLRLILTAFLREFPNYTVTDEPDMIVSNLVHAMKTLPVKLNG